MRVLLDCDGVVADWTKAVKELCERCGHKLDETQWFERGVLPKDVYDRVTAGISARDFNFGFDVLPFAREAIFDMRAAGIEVHFVTSLWDCPTWVYDRNRWLRMNGLAKAPSGVTYTKDKYVVKGDIFVDDKISNVEKWAAAWPNGIAICWAQPWNTKWTGPKNNRFNNWDRLVQLAITMQQNESK